MTKLLLATEAIASGEVSRRQLARQYTKLYRNVYHRNDITLTAVDRAHAAWLWSGRHAIVAGLSAAALLGSRWVPADRPAELIRVHHRTPTGIVSHKDDVAEDEVCDVNGISCTTTARTAFDLGRWLPFEEGLIRVDALLNATDVAVDDVSELAARYPGSRNIRRLRRVIVLADGGAESPQESRLRLALIGGGLPRPVTQIPVRNSYGRVVRRIDMGWPQWKVGVEYDGEQHWTDARNHAGDIDRLEFLSGLGWRIIRVSALHLRTDRVGIVRRAENALRAAAA